MERKIRYVWWGVLGILLVAAVVKFILPHNASSITVEKADDRREIVVYVTGAVENPGLVHLPINARLDDALKQANPLPEANMDLINPAEKLKDGQKVLVPYKPVPQPVVQQSPQSMVQPTPQPGVQSPVTQPQVQVANTNPNTNPNPNPNAAQGSMPVANSLPQGAQQGSNPQYTLPSSSNLININTADLAELDKLPGIGPALAERIIQYRMEHGPFLQPEDLKKVSGIGDKTYEKMAAKITVGP